MRLTEFLLARIAEDEAIAKDVRQEEHLHYRDDAAIGSTRDEVGYETCTITSGRVLAECEAKRRIIAEADTPDESLWYEACVLRPLAMPYTDHDDYQQEWGVPPV